MLWKRSCTFLYFQDKTNTIKHKLDDFIIKYQGADFIALNCGGTKEAYTIPLKML